MPIEEKTVTVQFQGKDCRGVKVAINKSTEHWSSVLLADGTEIKIKAAVVSAIRLKGQFDNDGNPVYMVKSANLLDVSSPDSVREPPRELVQKVQ